MKIFDSRFSRNKSRYVFQCALATCCVLVVLAVLDVVADTVVIASLGASSFLVFAVPDGNVSRIRFLLGGYIVGCAVGTGCYWLAQWAPLVKLPVESATVYGALAVGLTMFLMVITNAEHPPAAGVALGLVVQQWSWGTVLVAIAGVFALVTLRTLLRPVLIRLV